MESKTATTPEKEDLFSFIFSSIERLRQQMEYNYVMNTRVQTRAAQKTNKSEIKLATNENKPKIEDDLKTMTFVSVTEINFMSCLDETEIFSEDNKEGDKKLKKLRFNPKVEIHTVPSLAFYMKEKLIKPLWWGDKDYFWFRVQSRSEVKKFMRSNKIRDMNLAAKILFRGEGTHAKNTSVPTEEIEEMENTACCLSDFLLPLSSSRKNKNKKIKKLEENKLNEVITIS